MKMLKKPILLLRKKNEFTGVLRKYVTKIVFIITVVVIIIIITTNCREIKSAKICHGSNIIVIIKNSDS